MHGRVSNERCFGKKEKRKIHGKCFLGLDVYDGTSAGRSKWPNYARHSPPVTLRLEGPSAADSAGNSSGPTGGQGAAWQRGSNLADNFPLCFSVIELASMETVSQTSANVIPGSRRHHSSGIMRH